MLRGNETWGSNTLHLKRAMSVPWSAGSVAPKSKMKHPQPHYSRTLALRILWQSFAVGGCDGLDVYSVPHSVSNLSHTHRFLRHGLNVSRLISVNVACLALTRNAEMHGESVFDIAWCCQPHWMGHGQHHNLKMDMMMMIMMMMMTTTTTMTMTMTMMMMMKEKNPPRIVNINKTEQSTTGPCVYLMGCTV